MHSIPGRRIILSLFLIFLLLPIYWLVNMSFKTNEEIVSTMTLWPHQPTFAHYMRIFNRRELVFGYINSLKYVVINTVISISVALPAAYAFSRYRFLGDKHLVFWLLSNRMAPAGGLCAAVLQSLFGDQSVRYPLGGRAGALHLQRPAGGLDSRRLCLRRSARDRRDRVFWTASRSPRSSSRYWCR